MIVPGPILWRCRIRWIDLADLVVPYHTDGKARAGRVELLGRCDELGEMLEVAAAVGDADAE